jgi:hypothetical protein
VNRACREWGQLNRVVLLAFGLASLCFFGACGTLQVGVERTVTPTAVAAVTATATKTALPATRTTFAVPTSIPTRPEVTPTTVAVEWTTYDDARLEVSLQGPGHWRPVPGEESR